MRFICALLVSLGTTIAWGGEDAVLPEGVRVTWDLGKAVRAGGTGPRAPGTVCAEAARMIDEAEAAFLAVAGGRTLRSWFKA